MIIFHIIECGLNSGVAGAFEKFKKKSNVRHIFTLVWVEQFLLYQV